MFDLQKQHIVCPRSSYQFYLLTYYIRWGTTSWADGTSAPSRVIFWAVLVKAVSEMLTICEVESSINNFLCCLSFNGSKNVLHIGILNEMKNPWSVSERTSEQCCTTRSCRRTFQTPLSSWWTLCWPRQGQQSEPLKS